MEGKKKRLVSLDDCNSCINKQPSPQAVQELIQLLFLPRRRDPFSPRFLQDLYCSGDDFVLDQLRKLDGSAIPFQS